MKYFWTTFGWIWGRRKFIGMSLLAALFFFVWIFPFSDLSDAVTTFVARATNNQIYLQADSIDLHLIPQPAFSATNLTIETDLPRLEAKWAKVTPSLFSILFSLPTMIKASRGDADAARSLSSKIGVSVDAEGILGGDLSLKMRSGSKSESGRERSRVSLALEKVNLKEVAQWADLSTPLQGMASVDSDISYVPDFQDQPEGEFDIRLDKFVLPAATLQVPVGEATFPINVPTLTLANVVLKGRLVGGKLIVEDGQFGASKDPLYGRIKGEMNLKIQMFGPSVTPVFGAYNLTVDLTTTAMVQKELSFAFITLDAAKEPISGGGARYLFRASGQGVGMAYVPTITRLPSF